MLSPIPDLLASVVGKERKVSVAKNIQQYSAPLPIFGGFIRAQAGRAAQADEIAFEGGQVRTGSRGPLSEESLDMDFRSMDRSLHLTEQCSSLTS